MSNYDWNQTDGVASNVTTNSAIEWAATSKHNDDDTTYPFSTNDGRVKEQAAAM